LNTITVELIMPAKCLPPVSDCFHPGGALQLLGLGMPDIIGNALSADNLAMHSLLELRDQLAELT
jgi:hypothetical protein